MMIIGGRPVATGTVIDRKMHNSMVVARGFTVSHHLYLEVSVTIEPQPNLMVETYCITNNSDPSAKPSLYISPKPNTNTPQMVDTATGDDVSIVEIKFGETWLFIQARDPNCLMTATKIADSTAGGNGPGPDPTSPPESSEFTVISDTSELSGIATNVAVTYQIDGTGATEYARPVIQLDDASKYKEGYAFVISNFPTSFLSYIDFATSMRILDVTGGDPTKTPQIMFGAGAVSSLVATGSVTVVRTSINGAPLWFVQRWLNTELAGHQVASKPSTFPTDWPYTGSYYYDEARRMDLPVDDRAPDVPA